MANFSTLSIKNMRNLLKTNVTSECPQCGVFWAKCCDPTVTSECSALNRPKHAKSMHFLLWLPRLTTCISLKTLKALAVSAGAALTQPSQLSSVSGGTCMNPFSQSSQFGSTQSGSQPGLTPRPRCCPTRPQASAADPKPRLLHLPSISITSRLCG